MDIGADTRAPYRSLETNCRACSGMIDATNMETMMQTISEIMTRDVKCISPQETVRRAAQMMDEMNVGSLPVCEGHELVGMVTDRDITVRASSAGQDPEQTLVEDVMSTDVHACMDDQPVDEVLQQMGDAQIRRVPVLDHNTQELIGIVSLGDMATKHSSGVDRALEDISTPSEPDRPSLNS